MVCLPRAKRPTRLNRGVPSLPARCASFFEADIMAINEKTVFVHAYTRVRKGRLEYVCQHFRSLPR